MQELFIPYSQNPLLANLTTAFEALVSSRDSIADLLSEFKARRGERIGSEFNRNMNDPLCLIRERAYEVAALRLEVGVGALKSGATALYNASCAIKAALADQDARKKHDLLQFGVEEAIAKSNSLCADDLIDKALRLHHEVVDKQLRPYRWHYFGIDRSFKAGQESADPREFVVMYSGHGSKFTFESNDGEPPAGPYLTFTEAKAEASHWVGYADTIGGDAVVYNVRTKEQKRWY